MIKAKRLNLLPPERRNNLRKSLLMKSARRLSRTVMTGLFVITTVGFALLIGLWVMSILDSSVSEIELEANRKEYSSLRQVISRHNKLLTELDRIGRERVVWSSIIDQLIATAPAGTVISFMSASMEDGRISFSGKAPTRSSLVAYEDGLKLLPWVEEVVSPSNNLTERNNPTFEFEVRVKENVMTGPSSINQ